jgi:hypothetical protein
MVRLIVQDKNVLEAHEFRHYPLDHLAFGFESLQRFATALKQAASSFRKFHSIGSAFRGSSALHAVGDSYLLLARPSAHLAQAAVEMRFQFRYAAQQPSRLLTLDPQTLWFSAAGLTPAKAPARAKVEQQDVSKALGALGSQTRYNQLRQQIMDLTDCSKRTAQLAIADACRGGVIVQADGQYRLPL